MLGAIYVGLAGMNAYSKGLDLISNNVANLNTTGFKAGISTFGNVVYRNGGGATQGSSGTSITGAGVQVDAEQQNFRQGDLRSTNNPLDAALEGSGFFILERDGQRFYTRAGQFEFDKDGVLTERISGAKVMMSSDSQSLGSLQIDPFRVFQPRATTMVNLAGNLARTGAAQFDLTSLVVNDTSGSTQTLKVKFTRSDSDPLSWTVEVTKSDDPANTVLASGTLRFNADGTPAADNTPINVTVTPEGLPAFTFALNFGTAGSYAGVTSLLSNTNSQVQLLRQDGLAFGTLTATNFDERGNLEVTYSNGEKKKIGRLVLARFDSSGDLTSVGNGLYVTQQGRNPQLSGGLEFGLGRVSGGNLELSNVELTEQFTDLIIIQRGYQASSQMTSVANEMLQQLLSMQDRR
jgi:flagellar hook protein FlgE